MAGSPKVKPGVAGVWVGLLLMLLGLGGCIGGVTWGAFDVAHAIDHIERSPVPGSQEYKFDANASGIVFAFGNSSAEAKQVRAKLTGPSGEEITLDSSSTTFSSQTTDTKGDAVELIGAFEAVRPGVYTLVSEGPAGTQIAIASLSIKGIAAKVGGGIGGGLLFIIIGVIVMTVTLVRRSRAKKNLAMNPGGFMAGDGGTMPPAIPTPPTYGGGYPPAPPVPPGPPAYPAPPSAPSGPPAFAPPVAPAAPPTAPVAPPSAPPYEPGPPPAPTAPPAAFQPPPAFDQPSQFQPPATYQPPPAFPPPAPPPSFQPPSGATPVLPPPPAGTPSALPAEDELPPPPAPLA